MGSIIELSDFHHSTQLATAMREHTTRNATSVTHCTTSMLLKKNCYNYSTYIIYGDNTLLIWRQHIERLVVTDHKAAKSLS